jgi:hypothetical protein
MNVQLADAPVEDRAPSHRDRERGQVAWHLPLCGGEHMLAAHPTSRAARGYARRQPESAVLYGVVRDHLPTLLGAATLDAAAWVRAVAGCRPS